MTLRFTGPKDGGRGEENRTPDLCIANAAALSQLSYAPHVWLEWSGDARQKACAQARIPILHAFSATRNPTGLARSYRKRSTDSAAQHIQVLERPAGVEDDDGVGRRQRGRPGPARLTAWRAAPPSGAALMPSRRPEFAHAAHHVGVGHRERRAAALADRAQDQEVADAPSARAGRRRRSCAFCHELGARRRCSNARTIGAQPSACTATIRGRCPADPAHAPPAPRTPSTCRRCRCRRRSGR